VSVAIPPAAATGSVALGVTGLRKQYPGTLAVDLDPDQRLEFRRGEIHALVGENGAGKSTLVGLIAGVAEPSDGEMDLAGERYAPRDVVDARKRGVDIVLQEPGLVDTMTVEENLLLGREATYAPFGVFRPAVRRRLAEEVLTHISRSISLSAPAGSLNLEDQKFVELARALSLRPRVLVIDEMTASLSERGVPELFEILRAFADGGGTVVYISHHLEEVRGLCDRVTVMKDGRLVRTLDAKATTEDELSTLMVGRAVKETMYGSGGGEGATGELLLEVSGLCVDDRFADVKFELHAGEILGIGGLVGCGSETLALALFGDVRPNRGEVRLRGKPLTLRQPGDAIRAGIGFVPGDREREGLILNLGLDRNIALPALPWLERLGMIGPRVERRIAHRLIREMRIVARGPADVPYSLSGGNRQKVVLSKWLVRKNAVLILHNPTRGVDVGGKSEIYGVMRELADAGLGIVLISDDLPELIGLSDQLMIMRRGAVSATVARTANPTEELLIGYML
jgi:ABC-type sugar transport system ATPase subunit